MTHPRRPEAAVIAFLENRRSRPAKTLTLPVPDTHELMPILQAAARTPDHGKLEPWRFVVLARPALERLAGAAQVRAAALERTSEDAGKAVSQFAQSHLAVVVVESPKASDKVPPVEQSYSAGAVCLALLNAALAHGWGANWLSGWISHDLTFCETELGLRPGERVAGIIHIGTETARPPERPRPDLGAITTWMDA